MTEKQEGTGNGFKEKPIDRKESNQIASDPRGEDTNREIGDGTRETESTENGTSKISKMIH